MLGTLFLFFPQWICWGLWQYIKVLIHIVCGIKCLATIKGATKSISTTSLNPTSKNYKNKKTVAVINNEIKIKLKEKFFKQPLLLKKTKIIISEILKDTKLELMNEKNKEEILINNFINLKDNKILVKIKEIITNYNNIYSNEFNV